MAGPVQEISFQQQATKRSAEADPEPSPVTKRPAEGPECIHQSQPMDATTNVSLFLIVFWFVWFYYYFPEEIHRVLLFECPGIVVVMVPFRLKVCIQLQNSSHL